MADGVVVTCNHCKHKWTYKGQLMFATCTSCTKKVRVKKLRGKK